MPPNVSVFQVDVAVKATLAVINQEGGPFAMSDQALKANKILLDSIEKTTSSGLQGEVPRDFKWMLDDLEIGMLKSSIEIQAKVRKLLNDCSSVREAVDDNTQPLEEFLENIKLSEYAEALASKFKGLTVEDFTDGFTEEELATELEPITSTIHRKKVVKGIKECGAKKDHIEDTIKEMRETLAEILELSKKMAKDIPTIKQKMRDAIRSKEKVQAKCLEDKNYSSWAKLAFGGLCVIGAVATLGVGIAVAGGALAVGTAASAGGVLATGATASGCYAYYSQEKTLELSDYLAQLEETLNAMDAAQSHVQKREADWLNFVHDPASQAQTDQNQLGKRVAKLPSSTTDKQRFQKDMENSEKTLQKFDEGMTTLKESATAVLKVLHGNSLFVTV